MSRSLGMANSNTLRFFKIVDINAVKEDLPWVIEGVVN